MSYTKTSVSIEPKHGYIPTTINIKYSDILKSAFMQVSGEHYGVFVHNIKAEHLRELASICTDLAEFIESNQK